MSIRVGDVVEDYCSRCKLVTDHSVMALVNEAPAKVNCRTCNRDHDYRGGKAPEARRKTQPSAYDQVLASILAESPAAAPPPPKKPRRKKS